VPAGTSVAPFAGEVIRAPFAAAPGELPGPFQVADGDEEHAARANTPANANGAIEPTDSGVCRQHPPIVPAFGGAANQPVPVASGRDGLSRWLGARTARPAAVADQNDGTYVLGRVTVTGTALPLMSRPQDRSHAVQPLPSATWRGVPLMLTGSPTMLF